jgi:hypothetical protein
MARASWAVRYATRYNQLPTASRFRTLGALRARTRKVALEGVLGVLGVLGVAQDPPAHPQHHRAVSPYQRRKRSLVPPGDEPAE